MRMGPRPSLNIFGTKESATIDFPGSCPTCSRGSLVNNYYSIFARESGRNISRCEMFGPGWWVDAAQSNPSPFHLENH